jgi:cytochrome c oxidase subunit 4
MMAVSCTKAMLVIMFFMHLLWEANWKWVLTIPATFMSIFLMLMLVPDVGWRQNNGYAHYSEERLLFAADPPSIEAAEMKAAKQKLSHEGPH